MGSVLAFAMLAILVFLMMMFFLGEWGLILAAALLIGGLIAGLVSVMDRLDRLEKKLYALTGQGTSPAAHAEQEESEKQA